MQKRPRMPSTRDSAVTMEGGLDQVTAPLALPPGMLRDCLNYEIDVNGGYRSLDGYERYDGQPSPSDASYAMLGIKDQTASHLDCPGSANNNASTPSIPAFAVTGDQEIRARVAADDWTSSVQYVLGRYASATSAGFSLRITELGELAVDWVDSSNTYHSVKSSVAVGFTDGDAKWIRATIDVDNGAAGHDVDFYTSDDGSSWTPLGVTQTTAGVTTVQTPDLPYVAGNYAVDGGNPFAGKIYNAEYRAPIGGSTRLDFDPTDAAVADTSFTGGDGLAWTVNQSGATQAEMAVDTVANGDTIVGASSGATATVIAVESAAYALTAITGAFTDGERIDANVGPLPVPSGWSADGTQLVSGASSNKLDWDYKNLAADELRQDILVVPGSGSVLGVHRWNGVMYAFRNNAGGTAVDLYKSSGSGWTQVSFEYEVAFTVGQDMADGETLTQGGVTATIRRVVTQSGSMSGGTAVGILVISVASGGNFSAGAATTTGGSCTLGGAETAITLSPNGRFQMVRHNFGTAKRIYGADGVNRGFEFDGTYFVPIPTGMTTDTPDKVIVHKQQLFFAFGQSLQHSGPGDPFAWSVVLGASEINVGSDITNLISQPGSAASAALWITTLESQQILYGTSVSDWNLIELSPETGGEAYTARRVIGRTYVLDGRGVSSVEATQDFGNFHSTSQSKRIRPFLTTHRGTAVESITVRDKNQYRIFFSDNYALYMTVDNQKVLGMMPVLLGFGVTCAASDEESDGTETQWAGGDDGYVYQMDIGTSFDGDPIGAYFHMVYNQMKSPRQRKRFRGGALEVNGIGYSEFNFQIELGYGSDETAQGDSVQALADKLTGGSWDVGTWDVGFWDGKTLLPAELDFNGTAENVSLRVYQNNEAYAPVTFQSLITHYSPRRRMR